MSATEAYKLLLNEIQRTGDLQASMTCSDLILASMQASGALSRQMIDGQRRRFDELLRKSSKYDRNQLGLIDPRIVFSLLKDDQTIRTSKLSASHQQNSHGAETRASQRQNSRGTEPRASCTSVTFNDTRGSTNAGAHTEEGEDGVMLIDLTSSDGGFGEFMARFVLRKMDDKEGMKATQRTREEQKRIELAERRRAAEEKEHTMSFWFVTREHLLSTSEPLPRFQELRDGGTDALVEHKISRREVIYQQLGAYDHILSVSHRWEERGRPDVNGTQQAEVRRYLEAHPEITLVWFDFWCMPQAPRSAYEQFEFDVMLLGINWLYMGSRTLVLLDLSYLSRFWTQVCMAVCTRDDARSCAFCACG